MSTRRLGGTRVALLLGTAAILAASACGSSSSSNSSGGSPNNPNQNATGSVVSGGTLTLLGNSDVDHLDTASSYYTATYTLERGFARQLVTYPASTDVIQANSVAADVATVVPTQENGGISSDGKTYTFHLRSGVMWNTTPPRAVTAQDFLLGLKRLCNPVAPVGAPGYYTDTIVGMKAYCDAFTNVTGTAAAMKAYILGHDISGITTPDNSTLVIKLLRPASDFLNILAMPFASAAPVEYLAYVPDAADFRQHTLSDGPYAIVKYDANREIDLDRNPAWSQDADTVRHQYVDHIKVVEGETEASVQQQLEAGTADLQWDTTVPTADVPRLQSLNDARMGIFPSPDTNPYEVFNLQSPNNGGALGKVAVRQALEYAVDKVALGQIYGGPALNTPLDQAIPPTNLGYQQFDPYPTPNHRGDAAKCKSMLAAAGYPNGLTLKDVYRNAGKHPSVYQVIKQDFANCGVTVEGVPSTQGDYYAKYLENPTNAKNGVWDMSEPGWVPDWYGNNGRSIIEPLFDGRHYGPDSTDYGNYNNATVNADIDKALSASTSNDAARYWHDADVQIMNDAPFIPFQTQKTPLFRSKRVHNAIFMPFSLAYDITQVWLNANG